MLALLSAAKTMASAPGERRRRWYEHAVLPLNTSALAFFRIILGYCCLENLIQIFLWRDEWLYDSGYVPRPESEEVYTLTLNYKLNVRDESVNIYAGVGSPIAVTFLLLVHIALAMSFLFGYHSKTSAVALFFFEISLKQRLHALEYGGDELRTAFVLWACFLNIGARSSLDRYWWPRRWPKSERQERHLKSTEDYETQPFSTEAISSIGVGVKPVLYSRSDSEYAHDGLSSYVILFQLAHLYATTGRFKTGKHWSNGTAVMYVLETDILAKSNVLRNFLLGTPEMCTFLTHATLYLESFAWAGFFIPIPYIRTCTALLFFSFHIGMHLTLRVEFFQMIVYAGLVATLPKELCRSIEAIGYKWLKKVGVMSLLDAIGSTGNGAVQIVFPGRKMASDLEQTVSDARGACRFLKKCTLLVFVYGVLAYDDFQSHSDRHQASWTAFTGGFGGLVERGSLPFPMWLRSVTSFLNINQRFNMFSPNPPLMHWIEGVAILGKTSNSSYRKYISILKWGRVDLAPHSRNEIHDIAEYEENISRGLHRPNPGFAHPLNHRIFKYFEFEDKYEIMLRPFGRWMCHHFNEEQSRRERVGGQFGQWNQRDENDDLYLIGARVFKFVILGGQGQRTPPDGVQWKGMIVESKSNHWCHNDDENEVMGLLGGALGTTIEETDENSNASNDVVSGKGDVSNDDEDLVDEDKEADDDSENSEDEEADNEDISNDLASVEEEVFP